MIGVGDCLELLVIPAATRSAAHVRIKPLLKLTEDVMFKNKLDLLTACICFSSLFAVGASYADGPQQLQGVYLGANAGAFWGQSDVAASDANSAYLNPYPAFGQTSNGTLNPSNYTVGLEGGYNLEVDPIVLGVALDFDSLGINDTRLATGIYTPDNPLVSYVQQQTIKTSWLFTLRPRLGYLLFNDHLLIYSTGGLAITQLSNNYLFSDGNFSATDNKATTQCGWTVGAGLEYLFPRQWHNWSIGLEYLYADFGSASSSATSTTLDGPGSGGYGQVIPYSASLYTNIIRVGINYHF